MPARAPEDLCFGSESLQKAQSSANRTVMKAENERQKSNLNIEEEFQRKRDAYVGELKGLRESRDQCNLVIDELSTAIRKLIKELKKYDREFAIKSEDEIKQLVKTVPDKSKNDLTGSAKKTDN